MSLPNPPPLPDLPIFPTVKLPKRKPSRGSKAKRVLEPDPPPPPMPDRLESMADLAVDLSHYGEATPRTAEQRLIDEMTAVAKEISRRQREGLKLYEPMPHQAAFHQSRCRVRLSRGSTRSGKTTVAAVDVAYAVTNTDPCHRFPDKGIVYIVGFTEKHHSKVTYPKLFKPGALKCILDPHTKTWRGFRPWQEWDAENEHLALDAEPLIPERFVEEVAWENKREEIPSMVRLTTGWVIYFFSGAGNPPRGQAIDLGWMDEEIGKAETWYSELVSRTVDRRGCIIWSFAPQTGTPQAYELSELAEAQAGLPDATVEEYVMKLAGNTHIAQREKDEMAATITSEVERMVRIEGEYVLDTQKVYGAYQLGVHGWELPRVPADWTRYLIVDPGHQIACGLFVAVPPEDECPEPGTLLLYDELYLPRANAASFATALLPKVQGQSFERFVIDYRGSRSTEAGSGKSIKQQYEEEFLARRIFCRATQHRLSFGSDDLKAGVEMVRRYLAVKPGRQLPRLRVLAERTTHNTPVCRLANWHWEINRYRHRKVGDLVLDEPDQRGRVHAMDCTRYACMANLVYVPPEAAPEAPPSPVYQDFLRKQRSEGRPATVFGPASAALNRVA